MSHGLKSLTQELPQYGRYNDDMVAHISSDEARLLKSLGGAGTVNPVTGLPEFGGIGNPFESIQRVVGQLNPFNPGSAVSKGIDSIPIVGDINRAANNLGTQIFQPLEKAVVQPASAGLSQFDKAVGKAVPGGWGTVAAIAGSAMGVPTPFMVGLGALNGSGVMRKGGNFNLQGAIMGGAMAYGASELGEYARAAGGASDAVEKVAEEGLKSGSSVAANGVNAATGEIGSGLAGNASSVLPPAPPVPSVGDFSGSLTDPTAGMAQAYTPPVAPPPPGIMSNLASGNVGDAMSQIGTKVSDGFSNLGTNISEGASNIGTKASNFIDKATTLDTYGNAIDRGMTNAGNTASGIGNILTGNADPAAAAAVKAGTITSPLMATGATIYGGMGLAALDEQRKYLSDQAAAGAISNAQYNESLAQIEAQAKIARQHVAANPLRSGADADNFTPVSSLYGKEDGSDTLYSKNSGTTLYAGGGNVMMNPPDDQTSMPNRTPMQNFENGGIMSMIGNTVPQQMYASGGMTEGRFLSGGGDGMSDSIKASINGSQEARLADGEFVVPADVVSHIGNGSSKAGAKQLYSMMDRVRQARVGNKKQGKQINPRKYLAA